MSSGPPLKLRCFLALRRRRTELGNETGCVRGIACVFVSELPHHLALFDDSQARVHQHEYREHDDCEDRRPLEQEAEQNRNEADVLRVPDTRIEAARGTSPWSSRRSFPAVDADCDPLVTSCLSARMPIRENGLRRL